MKRNAPRFSSPEPGLSGGEGLGRGLLFLHLLLSPLLFVRDTVEVFEFPKVALLHLTAILLVALGLSSSIRRIPPKPSRAFLRETFLDWARHLIREPISAGFLLFLLSAAVSTATSISPRTSLQGAPESCAGLFTILAYTILFFATRQLCGTLADGRRLLAAPVIAAAAASVYALLQTARLDPIGWEQVSYFGSYARPLGTMGHPNLLAAFLVMTLPLTLFCAWQAARQRQGTVLAVLVLACGLAGLTILASVSRGAWLALLGSLAILLIGWLRWHWGKPTRTMVWTLPLAVAGVVLLGFAWPGGRDILTQVIDRGRHWNDSPSRLHIWGAGLRLFQAFPLFGCGLDTFQLAFGRVRTPAYWHTEWNGTPSRAHNEAIHLLATQGLLGAVAVLVLTAGLIRAAVRTWRRGSGADRMLGVALTAAIAGFYLQDLFSFTVAGCGTLFVSL
ncbi:MAG: O-antigen ligase family protein, partial [Planctomycetes bacterium]|nr:O-antigen ligase family protein [Planctomycetota bacterium]